MLEQAELRVLALADDRGGLVAARLLADFGADVVIVEPPGGSRGRQAWPRASSGESLTWATFAAGSRSIVLDVEDSAHDREIWRGLLERADVLVTSLPVAQMSAWSLTPGVLATPGLIWAAITAFGSDGPKSDYAESDLIVWAAGGPLAPHRDGDRPPLRISVPQAYLHAGADAAMGVLVALYERHASGRGQFIDVSAQVSVGQATLSRILAHLVGDDNPEWQQQPKARADRSGSGAATPNSLKKWQCADGLIELHLSMGAAAGAFTNNLFGWLRDEGAVSDDIAVWDWREVPDQIASGELSLDDLERARSAVRAFLRTKTKQQVIDAAIERRLLSMAILDLSDVAASGHLSDRGFLADVEISGRQVTIPARIAAVQGAPAPMVRGRAPHLDEHRSDIEAEWLGADQHRADASPDSSVPDRGSALAGLKVLDLSWVVAGPLMGRTLADFGADVIRVESSRRVETARMMQPFHQGKPDPEGSALFGNCNAGKRGMSVNLASERGREIIVELVRWADVVVESFSPGQMKRWGLDYATLSQINPALIMVSSSIAGQDGPWSKLAGFGNVGSSLSGFQNLVGWPDRLPMGPFGPYTDYVGPRIGLVALLSALEHRRFSGRGCHVDVSQVESGVFFLSPQIAHVGLDGVVTQRAGNDDGDAAPHGVYVCADDMDGHGERFVAIAVQNRQQWAALALALGQPGWAHHGDFATVEGRREHRAEIDAAISAWTRTQSAHFIEQTLQRVGVPAHEALDQYSYPECTQIRHREHLVELPHRLHGHTVVEGARVDLASTPGGPAMAAPGLGEHTDEILAEILHWDRNTIQRYRDEGALT